MTAWLHRLVCAVLGHSWGYYWYPHGDDWFSNPHERRYCSGCHTDEATNESPRRTSYLPGDLVRITLPPDDICNQDHNGKGVVTHGPDKDGGWIVASRPGALRCEADELTMITPREER